MLMRYIFDKKEIRKKADVLWDVYCQELEQNYQRLKDVDCGFVHVADLADGHHGIYTFEMAYDLMEENELDILDVDGPNYQQSEWLEKWTKDASSTFGAGFYVDWFETDGSISLLYRPEWDEEAVLDNFSGNWAKAHGISSDRAATESDLSEYLSDVESMLRAELKLAKQNKEQE